MAITIPIISEFRDAGLKKAEQELNGFTGKASKAFKLLQASSVAAGAAMAGKFAYNAVQAFQDLSLEAGRFSTTTGLAIEDASRWIEVTGDLGVETSTIEKAMVKMNRAIADNSPTLNALGVEVSRTSDGLVDANQTFLDVVGALGNIEDSAQLAKAGNDLFGRGFTEMADLIGMSAGELEGKLKGVSSAKIVTPDQNKQAQELRDTMGDLRDRFEDAQQTLGKKLAPVLQDAAQLAIDLSDAFKELDGAVQDTIGYGLIDAVSSADTTLSGFSRALDGSNNSADRALGVIDGLVGSVPLFGDALADLVPNVTTVDAAMEGLAVTFEHGSTEADKLAAMYRERVPAAVGNTITAISDLDTAYDLLTDNISDRKAWRDFQLTMFYLGQTIAPTQEQLDDFALAVGDVILELDDIPEQTRVELLTMLDQGRLDEVNRWLFNLQQGINVPLRPTPTGSGGGVPKRAMGGPVTGNTPYLVGERGPELFVPTGSGRIVPNHALSDQSGPMTVNIYTSADPNEVARALEIYRRRNGTVKL